jgi:penicillin V acylase-like amidase (Ntn superfamily)
MHVQQKYYHGHMPAHFPIQDMYGDTVQVERIDAGKILEGAH